IIRGASPEDSRILVDGFEIPVLYHFLGVQSVLPSEMIEDVEYQPGTFGVSQGRASGGLVSVTSRGEATKAGGHAELSFINVAGLVQGPIGSHASYAVAARRSLLDAILPAVIPSDAGLNFTAYPRYFDYQAKLTYRPTSRWTLAAFAFGSDDQVRLLTDGDNAMDPASSGKFENATSFTRLIGSARYRAGALTSVTGVSGYTDTNHFTIGHDRFLHLDRDGVAARSELTWDAQRALRVSVGAEADLTRTTFAMKFTRPPREGDPGMPNFSRDALLETTGSTTFPDLATWLTGTWNPRPDVELTGGARLDAFVHVHAVVAQPRGQVVWHVGDGSTVRAAAGLYTRPPEHLDEGLQDQIEPERAIQTAVGGERQLTSQLSVSSTVFYNRLSQLLVLPADRADPMSLGGYENQGTGAAYGVELLLKYKSDDVFGWLAYTGSRATRRDAADAASRRFDYDQAHNLIAVGSWQLGRHWTLGGRFQLTTGKPYTPVTGASYQADVDLYVPTYGAINSRRVATQHQLDLRIDHTWQMSGWKLGGLPRRQQRLPQRRRDRLRVQLRLLSAHRDHEHADHPGVRRAM
ncbi:MAG: hypothetical protein NT062_24030, partial [Proteobacteria bacterium]|nr:hypothetical protein [Pseudomonadota bacterium]